MEGKLPFELTWFQFRLKIAFVLTINRAKEQSFRKCGILLPKTVWTHGQVYVAFLTVGTLTTILYGQSSHISKIAREDWSLGRNISKI